MVASEAVDIIAVTESWIDTDGRDFEGEFELPGYTMFKKDRTGRQGGGVLIYIKNHLQSTHRPIDSPHELIRVEITGRSRTLHLFVVYRPPHQQLEIDLQLYNLLTQLMHDKVAVIVGDFNCNIAWETRTPGPGGDRLLDFVDDNFLTQMVTEPTRGANILDLILCSEADLVSNVSIGEPLDTSDHNMVRCHLKLPTNPRHQVARQVPNLRLADYAKFRRELGGVVVDDFETTEEVWSSFKTKFMAIQATCIPNRSSARVARNKPPWFTRELGAAINNRKRAYLEYKRSPTQQSYDNWKSLAVVSKRLTLQCKRNEEIRVASLSKRNPKEFFRYVNSRKPARSNIGPLASGGNLITSDVGIAGVLNEYFTSVFTEESVDAIPETTVRYLGEHPLSTITCTEADILDKIGKLKANKSAGPDGYLPRVVKAVSNEIAPHLLKIFNKSLETGTVPDDMHIANVTPIFKKGPKDSPGNYRPISLTSTVGKMLESVIADQIVQHLEDNSLLGNSQHGFRKKRSCLTNLLTFFHHMLSVYDHSGAIDILYLDFKKAFDKVPHKRLLSKVRALGVVDRAADWIEHWLSGRRQRVVVNGECSEWAPVSSGVPQGSVLGPLLFLIYINDLDTGIISKLSKFADDTKLGANAANPTAVAFLQDDLNRIGEWSEKWQMPFNTDKCAVMHIGYHNPATNYSMLGSDIPSTTLEKDLGVLISSDLKFTRQCLAAEKKAQKVLGYIRRHFRYRNKDIVLPLYNALVRPVLEYAVQFWSPTLQCDIKRLERVQARATRLIPAIRFKGYGRRLRDLNLLTLDKRRLRGQLIETFKALRGFNNIDFRQLFELSDNQRNNHGWKVRAKRFRRRPCGDFMTYRICNVWNRLPAEVVNSPSVDTFKTRLDRIIGGLTY